MRPQETNETGEMQLVPPWQRPVLGTAGVLVVFAIDFLTGSEISFSIFYLPSIAYVAWNAGFRPAICISILSGVCWFSADLLTGHVYTRSWIPVWNALMRTMIFMTLSLILSRLKTSIRRQQEARQLALDATRAKSDFLATMSHEIRTPLNAIIGAADILAETDVTREQSEYLEILKAEGEQARRLLNDILDFSKIEARRIQLEHSPFGLRKLIGTACQSVEPRCAEKRLDLGWTVSPELSDTRVGDPYRLRQIITNLLNNSVKFTENGGISVHVDGSATRIQVTVQDSGIGIPLEQQAGLFGRFNQAEASVARRYGGSGLGLSIAKGLVEAMNGQIGFESAVNRGTKFFFDAVLPEAGPNVEAGSGDSPIVDSETFPKPARVLDFLLADDYEFNRRIIGRFVQSPFVKLELAQNGRDALEKITARQYDLVLLDMHMPEMDGWTVAREVRKREKERATPSALPIVALTASALKEDEEHCFAAGCTSFLGKPIRKKDLLNEVERVLNLRLWTEQNSASAADEPELDPEIAKLIPGFLDEVADRCEALIRAVGIKDLQAAAATAHQLIGLGGTYGYGRISEIGRHIETAAFRNDPAKAARLAGELKAYVYGLKENYE